MSMNSLRNSHAVFMQFLCSFKNFIPEKKNGIPFSKTSYLFPNAQENHKKTIAISSKVEWKFHAQELDFVSQFNKENNTINGITKDCSWLCEIPKTYSVSLHIVILHVYNCEHNNLQSKSHRQYCIVFMFCTRMTLGFTVSFTSKI